MNELDKSKNQNLIEDLSEITRNHVERKFAVVAVNRELQSRLSKEDRDRLRVNSYALAGRTASRCLRLWAESWNGPLPRVVFEKGDAGADDLRYLHISQGYPEPLFMPKNTYTDAKNGIVRQGAVPLQAADLLANTLFCNVRESALTGRPLERLPSGLDKIPGEPGEIEADRYDLIKQGIEQQDQLILVPGVKVNVRAGEHIA